MTSRGFDRKSGVRDVAKTLFIATEDSIKSFSYFDVVRNSELLEKRIEIKLIERPEERKTHSSLKHVFHELCVFYSDNDMQPNDELWLVADGDHDHTEKHFKEIFKRIENDEFPGMKNIINFCISNPCFEVWLFLHFYEIADLESFSEKEICKCSSFSGKLKKLKGGYGKKDQKFQRFLPQIDEAIYKAKMIDKKPEMPIPDYVCTRIYRIFEHLL